MFCLNEKVVYPGHGVAIVNRLIKKQISNKEVSFYELTFLSKDITVLVPVSNTNLIGLRSLSSLQDVKDAFNLLEKSLVDRKFEKTEFSNNNWNKRNKEYQLKLRSGSLLDLLEIYKDLRYLVSYKELSFGEKNLLQQAEALLVEELSVIENVSYEKMLEKLRSSCSVQNKNINNFDIEENLI